jgi:hypothetical protein
MGKKLGSGSGIRNEQPGSYFLQLRNHFWVKILKFFLCGSGIRIRDEKNSDPGLEKVGSGIRNPKKLPGSTTLLEIPYIEDE